MATGKTKKTGVPPEVLKSAMEWILAAHDERDVRQSITDSYPDIDTDTVLAAAVDEITAIGSEAPEFTRGWALAATRELVRKMIESGDFANAMRGIKQVADLAD